MRARVYRNYTFKSYATEGGELKSRSDNFFTVESEITAILKDMMANKEGASSYAIYQESKDGKFRRAIEVVYTRENDDTVYIDIVTE